MPSSNEHSSYTLRHPLVPLKIATDLLLVADELTTRLEQGDFAASRPIELSDGQRMASGELAVRIALDEAESCIAAALRFGKQLPAKRWESLFGELQHLKATLDSPSS